METLKHAIQIIHDLIWTACGVAALAILLYVLNVIYGPSPVVQ